MPAAADAPAYAYVQGAVGVLQADDAWTYKDPVTGVDLNSDLGDLPYGGANAQIVLSEAHDIEFGFESGGLVSWDSDSRVLEAKDNSVIVELDNALYTVELAFGLFAAWKPADAVRFSVSAGPALVWGSVSTDDDSGVYIKGDDGAGGTVYAVGGRDYDTDFGAYARVGIDFLFSDELIMGLAAKHVNYTLDFDDNSELNLDGWQYFLTIGARVDL
ncbi:MAG TPA: hypothetical protein VIM96_04425 [Pseudomonadales bacterium]